MCYVAPAAACPTGFLLLRAVTGAPHLYAAALDDDIVNSVKGSVSRYEIFFGGSSFCHLISSPSFFLFFLFERFFDHVHDVDDLKHHNFTCLYSVILSSFSFPFTIFILISTPIHYFMPLKCHYCHHHHHHHCHDFQTPMPPHSHPNHSPPPSLPQTLTTITITTTPTLPLPLPSHQHQLHQKAQHHLHN